MERDAARPDLPDAPGEAGLQGAAGRTRPAGRAGPAGRTGHARARRGRPGHKESRAQGERGPQGEPGPAGEQGPKGDRVTPGVARFYTRTGFLNYDSPNGPGTVAKDVVLSCDRGDRAMGPLGSETFRSNGQLLHERASVTGSSIRPGGPAVLVHLVPLAGNRRIRADRGSVRRSHAVALRLIGSSIGTQTWSRGPT